LDDDDYSVLRVSAYGTSELSELFKTVKIRGNRFKHGVLEVPASLAVNSGRSDQA
jgi:hypothetical protein